VEVLVISNITYENLRCKNPALNRPAGFGFAVKRDGISNPQRLTDKNSNTIIIDNSVRAKYVVGESKI